MDLDVSDVELQSTENLNIDRVRKCLEYQFYGLGGWVALVLIIPWFIVAIFAAIAAILFIPLLIVTLVQERRYNWLVTFFVLTLVPPLSIYLTIADLTWTWVATLTSFGFFYFYCALLRYAIREW